MPKQTLKVFWVTTLVSKKKLSKKLTSTQIPPGGIRKDPLFLLAAIYNIRKLKLMQFGPCYLGSKGLQQACNKLKLKHGVGGSFWEALVRPRVRNWAESPSLFC